MDLGIRMNVCQSVEEERIHLRPKHICEAGWMRAESPQPDRYMLMEPQMYLCTFKV